MRKIKNILMLMVVVLTASVFAACSDDDDNAIVSHVTLDPDSVSIAADGGTVTVTAYGNAPVKTIASDASWLTAEAGDFLPTKLKQTITLTATENTSSASRTATVTITAGTLTLTLPVTQLSGSGSTDDRTGTISQAAMDIAKNMYPGWNLGNTLEAPGGETAWQSTVTTKAIIDYVKAQGFKAVRLPVSWRVHSDSNAQIDSTWMNRVKEIVNYCIDDSLYVILNDHWDNGWIEVNGFSKSSDSYEAVDDATIAAKSDTLKTLWTQIANTFKNYGDHLLFAGLNEPFQEYTLFNGRHAELTPILETYEQAFVDAVRATGGNNAKRTLVVQGPSTNIASTVSSTVGFNTPTDDTAGSGYMMVEVHYYEPWSFCNGDTDTWGSTSEVSYMETSFATMKTKFVDQGIPVIIGEYGANWQKDETAHNSCIKAFYKDVNEFGPENGMVPFAWDTNTTSLPSMTIINRSALSIFCTPALEGIQEGVAATTWSE